MNAQTKEGEYTLELADTPEMKEAVKAAKGFNREIVSIVYNRPPKPLDDDSEENLSNCALFPSSLVPPRVKSNFLSCCLVSAETSSAKKSRRKTGLESS